jgi:hypothetical protein
MILYPPTHSADLFTYEKGMFIGEISSLGRPAMGEVYSDACDLGFYIKNPKTLGMQKFRIKSEERNETEVTHWILEPCDTKLRDMGVLVTLFND